MTGDGSATRSGFWLLCRAGSEICALPVEQVIETMRPPPLRPWKPGHPAIRGISVIRGAPVPVLDLNALLGQPQAAATRLVTAHLEERIVAFLVEAVLGVRIIEEAREHALPPLLRDEAGDIVSSLGMLDAQLVLFLRHARLFPPGLLNDLGAAAELDAAIS